jgi:restriction system protein
MDYQRRSVEKAIILSLRDLGGTASRKTIRKYMADNEIDGLTYDEVYYTKNGKTGAYSPFMFDFGFSMIGLSVIGYIEPPERRKDIVLTELGRTDDLTNYPSEEQKNAIKAYWDERHSTLKQRKESKKLSVENVDDDEEPDENSIKTSEKEDTDDLKWKTELIDCLKKFDPGKFESFSRLLISKMGVVIDKKRGIVRSGDHGIDGFGYFTSDEFRTSRVAIQCKRYTDGAVSEPEIDKFKGVMDGFNAEYGIFVTTSHFTDNAKKKATQGNNTVTLIDGQSLADLVEKYQLHITPVTTFALDSYYYEKQ